MNIRKKILRTAVRAKNSNLGHKALLFGVALVLAQSSMAQSAGAAGFTQATTEFQKYKDPVQKLLYAIAAVISLVGAFNIYFKMQNGDQDVKKTIMMTVGGCVAFVAAASALPAFFN
ncbi:MAG: DUF4134 domain-containing protein [Candidatus Amulumruptor caecigallinarius]|nr:DUF4134 domain-containing protein [Candidatus Amulumruptor caecigallinarius]MCM1397344.1 DUF4134 domain-containing protein [Candidatus Amulumruptor caecigallinarius]MCM1453593.1 DUF4134 domain-containing protein [bacterium]